LKASKDINFIRIDCSKSNICNKNLTRAFSSYKMRYC